MNTQEIQAELAELIDSWCERRELNLLRVILQSYPIVNGLTDEWYELSKALKTIRISHGKALTEGEAECVIRLLHATDKIVYR